MHCISLLLNSIAFGGTANILRVSTLIITNGVLNFKVSNNLMSVDVLRANGLAILHSILFNFNAHSVRAASVHVLRARR